VYTIRITEYLNGANIDNFPYPNNDYYIINECLIIHSTFFGSAESLFRKYALPWAGVERASMPQ